MTEQEKMEVRRGIVARLSVMGSKPSQASDKLPNNNYWEKTVEWVFARKYFKPNLFLAPLSSTAEAAGDAMVSFSGEDRWLLIEFKRTKADFIAEQNKYPVFGRASKWKDAPEEKVQEANRALAELIEIWKLLKSLDMLPPHILVYGLIVQDNSRSHQTPKAALASTRSYGWHVLDVAAKSYWGDWCNHSSTSLDIPDGVSVKLDELRSLGWKLSEFKEYVRTLLVAKCVEGSTDSSSWMYDTVMSVAHDGTTKTLSMVEFAHNHLLIDTSPNASQAPQQMKSGNQIRP